MGGQIPRNLGKHRVTYLVSDDGKMRNQTERLARHCYLQKWPLYGRDRIRKGGGLAADSIKQVPMRRREFVVRLLISPEQGSVGKVELFEPPLERPYERNREIVGSEAAEIR